MKRLGLSYLLLAGLIGCGSGSDLENTNFSASSSGIPLANLVRGRTVTINQPGLDQLVRDGDKPDTLDIEGFNASGQRIFGPVRVPLKEKMTVADVPTEVVEVELDYLRNSGFMLFRAEAPLAADSIITPQAQQIEPNNTRFAVRPDGQGYVLTRELTGDAPSETTDMTPEAMRIKGVCYSPSPINFSNKSAPAVGDLFWDTFQAGPDKIWNWAALFLNFWDPNTGQARGDIQRIRDLGANTIRLYSCLSYQLNSDGTFPDLSSAHRFSHEAFLDACYNDNVKPLNVVVDIPMPDVCFRYRLKEALDKPAGPERDQVKAERAKQVAWWEANLRATVEDLSKHPAVIGFNIMNEQDGAEWSHPNVGAGPDNDETQYFYAQSVKYAHLVKTINKDKLCGWAFHDSPDLVVFGSQFPANGPKYLEQLSDFDYWGVNSYQTVNFDSVVGLPGSRFRGSYADLPPSMKKPVFLTELGWPATGHDGNQLSDTGDTQAATARVIKAMYPEVYKNPIFLGACYFEFSDEWWKQPGGSDSVWDVGKAASDFPNKFWDEEGFGLFSVHRRGGRANNDSPWSGSGPTNPYDGITPRQPLIDELKKVFQSVH